MKLLPPLFAVFGLLTATFASAAAPAPKIYAVTFTTGPNWDATKPAAEQKFMREHSANLARLRTAGISILGGRYADKGLLLVRASDEAAVRAELAQDPSLAAGTFQAAVDEYQPFQHGDTRPPAAPAASAAAGPKLKQWVYVLRLIPRLHDDQAWTDADKAAVSRHFAHLSAATKAGQVILAGRTTEPGDRTFGLVVFEAADEAAARTFMASDPSVVEKVMTAELHPYAVALQRKQG
jgi:uncharacterized protein YciI